MKNRYHFYDRFTQGEMQQLSAKLEINEELKYLERVPDETADYHDPRQGSTFTSEGKPSNNKNAVNNSTVTQLLSRQN